MRKWFWIDFPPQLLNYFARALYLLANYRMFQKIQPGVSLHQLIHNIILTLGWWLLNDQASLENNQLVDWLCVRNWSVFVKWIKSGGDLSDEMVMWTTDDERSEKKRDKAKWRGHRKLRSITCNVKCYWCWRQSRDAVRRAEKAREHEDQREAEKWRGLS